MYIGKTKKTTTGNLPQICNHRYLCSLDAIVLIDTHSYIPAKQFSQVYKTITRSVDHTSRNCWPDNDARIPGGALKLHRTVYSNGDTSKTNYLACLGSSMYQRTIDELQDELNSFERRLSTPTSGSYRRKIYDLEAICCADLNRVRSRFVKSLQVFENTIDSIEKLCPRRIKDPACQCATKKPPIENNTDAFRYERPTSRNAKCDRSLPRSKYVVTHTHTHIYIYCALVLRGAYRERNFTFAAEQSNRNSARNSAGEKLFYNRKL
ncbi:uncharacterized protein LOC143147863 [Ptiloglossa arizonensis]|uniref:uncharacterized protein LOC143147863 n=1 Tax=Ptiloglossa arizonensis TaxID=3350558 RepID=UPI003F9EFD11